MDSRSLRSAPPARDRLDADGEAARTSYYTDSVTTRL